MTLILDGGSQTGRINLVLVSEGYQASEIHLFRKHADQLAKFIQSESWYRRGYLNIHAHEVHSAEPATWLVPGRGPRDTPFRSQLGGDGKVDRLITGSESLVNQALYSYRGKKNFPIHIGVLVNSRRHGGRGQRSANMFWTCTGTNWLHTAMHEFGHSFADLRDEYSDDTGSRREWTYPEPAQPNVTTDPTGQKWTHITDTVFEGAARHDTGIYRPFETCRMRRSRSPFCEVCADVMRRTFESFMKEAPDDEPDGPVDVDSVVVSTSTTAVPQIIVRIGTEHYIGSDNSAGAIGAAMWILKRQFGDGKS